MSTGLGSVWLAPDFLKQSKSSGRTLPVIPTMKASHPIARITVHAAGPFITGILPINGKTMQAKSRCQKRTTPTAAAVSTPLFSVEFFIYLLVVHKDGVVWPVAGLQRFMNLRYSLLPVFGTVANVPPVLQQAS